MIILHIFIGLVPRERTNYILKELDDKDILWCGDVTADRLKWGNEVLKNRFKTGSKTEVSPETLKRIKRYVLSRILADFCFFFSLTGLMIS